MRRLAKISAQTAVACLLLGIAAAAQKTPAVIGQVVNSVSATQNGVPLPSGGTILDGDEVATGPSGQVVIQLSPVSQVSLDENTGVTFTKVLDQTRLRLQKGTVVVENSGKSLVVVATPKFDIQPAISGNSKLYVGLMADKSTYIESARGDVVILDTRANQSYVLSAGQNTLVPENATGIPGLQPQQPTQATAAPSAPAPPAAPPPPSVSSTQQPPAPPVRRGSSKTGLYVGLGVAAAAAGAVAAFAGGGHGGGQPASPTAP